MISLLEIIESNTQRYRHQIDINRVYPLLSLLLLSQLNQVMEMVKVDEENFYRKEVKKEWKKLVMAMHELQDVEAKDTGEVSSTGERDAVVNAGVDEHTMAVMSVVQQLVNTVVEEDKIDRQKELQKRQLKLLKQLGGDVYEIGLAFDPKDRTISNLNVNIVDEFGRAIESKRKSLMDDEVTAQLAEGRLEHATVVFCTLATAGSSLMKRFVSYVDTLVVDEAAQALESEVIIPLALGSYGFEKLDPKTGKAAFPFTGVRNLVLIGDPKQLLAIIVNKQTERVGRGTSCMQRLMEGVYRPVSAHLLNTQYRYRYRLLALFHQHLTLSSRTLRNPLFPHFSAGCTRRSRSSPIAPSTTTTY